MAGRKFGRSTLYRFAGLSAFAVLIGTSAASNVCALVGLAFAAIITRSWKTLAGSAALLVAAALLGMRGEDALGLLMPGKDPETVATLSGRTHIWEQYGSRFAQSPVLGEGFAISARLSEIASGNTHNALISVLMGLGICGGALFVLWALLFGREAFHGIAAGRPGAVGCGAGILAGLVNSLSCAYLGETYSVASLTFYSLVAFHLVFVKSPWGNPSRGSSQPRAGVRPRKGLPL